MLKLICCGTGDAFGSGGRLNACYFFQHNKRGILVDCGASSLIALKKNGLSAGDVDAIVISHLHGDHFAGIPFLIRESQIATHRSKPLFIIGPHGLEDRVNLALEAMFPAPASPKNSFEIQYQTFEPGKEQVFHSLKIITSPAVHSYKTEPFSLRLSFDDVSVAYSGDTEWHDRLPALTKDCELFICECYAMNKRKNHLSAEDLIMHIKELQCKEVVVVHMGDDVLSNVHSLPFRSLEDGEIIILRK